MTDNRNAFYLLSAHGDPWAIEATRMKAYLNTLIVSDMTADDAESRTGPLEVRYLDCEGKLLSRHTSLHFDNDWEKVPERLKAAMSSRKTKRAIAVLPLTGPITHRAGLFTAFFGGTSTEKWGRAFDDLVASPNVGAIVIDADTPGGTVSGVPELADKIFKARGSKPIVIVSNAMLASAGYWIGSSANEIVVTPSGEVGSIGVWSLHADESGLLEKMGIDITLISAGKFKTELNPFEPLDDEARAYEQSRVDDYYGQFVGAVARGRGVTASAVRKGFGEGRMVGAKQAVQEGMADRVGTLEQTIQRLGGRLAEREQARADHEKREKWLAEQEKELDLPAGDA
jgi:signal peptide peptidase SppA